jgi:hypothetical protein
MLAKLQRGEKLSERDEQVLEKLYEINRGVKERLSSFTESMDDNMLMQYLKNKGGEAADMLKNLQELTLEENRGATEKMEGAGMRPQPKQEENSEGMGEENGYKPYQAEEACAEYFKSYKIAEFQCVGETKTQKYSAYNVQGYDENGNLLFAEVDSKNGALLRFNYYQECSDTTLSMENSQNVAQEFLSALGYDNMTVVRAFENGSDMQLTFVYSVDGVNMEEEVTDPNTGEETIQVVNVPQTLLEQLQATVKIDVTPKSVYDRFAQEQTIENLLTQGFFNPKRVGELKIYHKILPDDAVAPKVEIGNAIEYIEEEQRKIAMIQAQAQAMQQRAQQFLMEDPDGQADQIADARSQIMAQEQQYADQEAELDEEVADEEAAVEE